MSKSYIFKSERLGFRIWQASDLDGLYAINSNPHVMEFFPALPTQEETQSFMDRMNTQFSQLQHCYFAVDCLETNDFIGFIGLSKQTYEADFTPCIDIGWRLDDTFWNKGFATEGALACLDYAFNTLSLKEIVSVCPKVNLKSEQVMKKIGMKKQSEFNHIALKDHPTLETCVLYTIKADQI